MWPRTSQKWQTVTNLGTSVFLVGFPITSFGSCLNKEQFDLIWPTTPQRWQVGTKKKDLLCFLTIGLDIGLGTSTSTSKLLPLSKQAK